MTTRHRKIFSILVLVLVLTTLNGAAPAPAAHGASPTMPDELTSAALTASAQLAIDALDYRERKIVAPDGADGDYFGNSVALSGDTAIVGAFSDDVGTNLDQGSAYVFTHSGTMWTLQQKLIASDGAANDRFGSSVALSGDTALVGALGDQVGANYGQGSAYVFTRSGSTWSEQAKLTAADGATQDYFGHSVALSGDTALIGSNQANIAGNALQGAAYVFTRSGTTWTLQQKLTSSDGAVGDFFGASVALFGNTALVGAYENTVGGNFAQGAAYVFTRSGTTWAFQQKLTASDGAPHDIFGVSVALSGDTALVGASSKNVGENSQQGSAYVFAWSGTSWTEQAKLTADDGATLDCFGSSVALLGDTALVGAVGDEIGANFAQGSAYLFTRSGASWMEQAKLIASDGTASAGYGDSVALSTAGALIGAGTTNIGSNSYQGSAYFYDSLFDSYLPLVQRAAP